MSSIAGLSDYQVRDLNDEINKLMREKLAWEHRIKELGGPDYFVSKTMSVLFEPSTTCREKVGLLTHDR